MYTVRKVLADFAVCDWGHYCKTRCDEKFCKIEGNGRNFSHIELSISVISYTVFSNSVECVLCVEIYSSNNPRWEYS